MLQTEEAGFLEAEGPISKTYKFSQEAIAGAVDHNTKSNIFDLELKQFGPYRVKYSRNGRNMLICGGRGHVASIDALTFKLSTEIHLRETTRDIQYLHNSTMFAVAQKKYVARISGPHVRSRFHSHIAHTALQIRLHLRWHWS